MLSADIPSTKSSGLPARGAGKLPPLVISAKFADDHALFWILLRLRAFFLLADVVRQELRHRLQNLFREREELGGAGVPLGDAPADFLAAGRQLEIQGVSSFLLTFCALERCLRRRRDFGFWMLNFGC